ncbi:MAG: TonB family protein [Candidatus Sulfotelmatobacter sp.]
MAAGAQPHNSGSASQRRVLRYQVQAPLDVTVLRQGIPHTLPGRSLNLCERGLAAVLAGEVLPGEAVGLELRLPLASGSLRTRALVRHHDKLRCGMEFLGLTIEQEALLRQWVKQAKPEPERASAQKTPELPETALETPNPENSTHSIPTEKGSTPPPDKKRALAWIFLLALLAILLAVCWWRWNRGWQEIESGAGAEKTSAEQPHVQVPAEVMEKLVIHRVDPDYPDAARQAQLEGVVVLDVIVGRDGSVVNMHPVSGPEVLTTAAMDALRWWRFEPYRVDGKPVTVETTVAVEFHP